MRIEFDPRKAATNLLKHGVSLADAESVLLDPLALTRTDDHASGEQRFVTLGMGVRGELLVAVWVQRETTVRLISCRRATAKEKRSYED